MRFLSRFGGQTITGIPPVEVPLATGKTHIPDHGVMVAFRHGQHIPDWEFDEARKRFLFNGLPLEEDGMTPISARYRVGVYDTDVEAKDHKWTPERKAEVEEAILTSIDYEQGQIILVEQPRAPSPWATYDELVTVKGKVTIADVIEQIKAIMAMTGSDPRLVLEYEKQNRNRAEVITALEEMAPPPEPEPEVEPALELGKLSVPMVGGVPSP